MMKKTLFLKTVLTMCLMAMSWMPIAAQTSLCGDCNGDGIIGIADVTCLIDYMLGNDQDSFIIENADTDLDGNIGISDVTTLIDYLLSGLWPWDYIQTEEFKVGDVTFKMVNVEGGSFMMGANEDNPEALDEEKPAHEVTLSNFMIGETEVTQALWEAVMGENPSAYNDDPNCPVENVSWGDCLLFISELNQMTGRKFRLPTEAEWEFASRGGNSSHGYRYAGGNNIDEVAWYGGNSGGTTHPVAARPGNELGLYDMSGNVWEWCLDGFEFYNPDSQTDPVHALLQSGAVCRGGFFDCPDNQCRVTQRMAAMPDLNEGCIGLRLALDREDSPKFRLAEPVVVCELDETIEVEILNGSGNYAIGDLGDEECASVSISGNKLRITGLRRGTLGICVTDISTDASLLCAINVRPFKTWFTVEGVTFRMKFVKGGKFSMGATIEQQDDAYTYGNTNEYPVHEVTLTDFLIGETEVTQELWQAVMGSNPSYFRSSNNYPDNLQRPVENVSWQQCWEFIGWLNLKTGLHFRLPTEAQWEFAARGGNLRHGYKYSGSNNINRVAWYATNSSWGLVTTDPDYGTHTVATKSPNELGIYDMSGNVWEWVSDWAGTYTSFHYTNPTGPVSGSQHVFRGGSWDCDPVSCRVSRREVSCFGYRGLRLELDADDCPRLSDPVVFCGFGESKSVEILNGSGCYTIAEGLEGVEASISDNVLTVTATATGTTSVNVIDDITGYTYILIVIVKSDTIDSEEFTVGDVSFKMVNVEGGTFTMGALDDDLEAEDFEKPAHPVTLSDYMIGETEVTQALWEAVMGYCPSDFNEDPNCPVEMVSWEECQTFIYRLNQMTGRKFRLPTEAEWEFAARGGKSGQGYRFAGSNDPDEVAWFNCDTPQPVGSKMCNELGLFDMSGNVREWCLDGFQDYSAELQTDPVYPLAQSGAVCRGGLYGGEEHQCRVTQRMAAMPAFGDVGIGLRLALDREDSPKFRFADPVATCELDGTIEIEILNGSGDFSINDLGDDGSVIASIDEKRLIITPLQLGPVSISITDNVYNVCAVSVIEVLPPMATVTVYGVDFPMKYIPSNTFMMGATPEQIPFLRDSSEYYAHQVTLDSYYIGQTEVTQEQWQAVMNYNPSHFTGDPKLPVENVSWEDCQAFIYLLNAITGQHFRLPTEAEWECAARGASLSHGYVYAGTDGRVIVGPYHTYHTLGRWAWYQVSANCTHPVATRIPNELGLFDMSGNVREYCLDYWSDSYGTELPQKNPQGPELGNGRVARGGSWNDESFYCRVSARTPVMENQAKPIYGFRLAFDRDESPRFRLLDPVLKCGLGGSVTTSILNGHGNYTIADGLQGVSVSVNGDMLTVTGTATGTTTVYIIDEMTGSVDALVVIVEPD